MQPQPAGHAPGRDEASPTNPSLSGSMSSAPLYVQAALLTTYVCALGSQPVTEIIGGGESVRGGAQPPLTPWYEFGENACD
jgi:hypothetical protein